MILLNIAKVILIFIWILPFLLTIFHSAGKLLFFSNVFEIKILFAASFLSATFLLTEWILALRTVVYFSKAFKYLRSYNLVKLDRILKKIPISKCLENGKTLLQFAIDKQMTVDIITFLLSKEGLVTYKSNSDYNVSYTLFYLASYYDSLNEKLVNYLLNKGAYINFIDNSRGFKSLSLLQVFVLRCQLNVTELLINKGADLHYIVPDLDMNALMLASKYINNPKIVILLAQKGGGVNKVNNNGYTAMLFAAEYNPNPEIIYALVDLGAKIIPYKIKGTMLRINNVTPLRLAVVSNNIDVINALINLGDSVNFKDLYGFSILFIAAAHHNDVRVIELLLANGARLEQANDSDGNTPLMGASYLNGNIDIINYLIEISDNLGKRNSEGLSFLDYLKENTLLEDEDKQYILQKFLN